MQKFNTFHPLFSKLIVLVLYLLVFIECHDDRVLLRNIDTITLFHNEYTNSRRSSSIPQLKCVGGSAIHEIELHPATVQCYNRGFDGTDVQWECKSQLSPEVKFGRMFVNCEGYSHPDDPYVLKGSCGLEYELQFTNRRSHKSKTRSGFHSWTHTPNEHYSKLRSRFPSCLPIIGLLGAACGIYWCCLRRRHRRRRPHPGGDYTPMPVPDDAWAEQPPDYDTACRESQFGSRNRTAPSAPPAYGWDIPPGNSVPCTGPGSHGNRYFKTQQNDSWWTSNLLSGGLGAIGGYMFGSATSRQQEPCVTAPRDTEPLYPDVSSDNSPRHYRQSFSPHREASGFAQTRRR